MTKNILFRADSSSTIGTGHIMRDLVLASQYKDSKISFATLDLKGNINSKILENGYNLEILKSNDKKELIKLIKKLKVDLLIIDHYEIDYKKEKFIKEKTGVKILALDDTYEKHYCDILLNHNISAERRRYVDLVPKKCELRCGSKYTLLREEFYKEKRKLIKKKKTKTIFLAMGGADHSNINIGILKVLNKIKNIRVNLVTTNANKNLEILKEYTKNNKWIKLHINSTKIARLMSKSDFSIVTPSVTVNEVCYLGLPMVVIKTASNQIDVYRFLKKEKYTVLKKFDAQKLEKKVKKMLRGLR